MDNPESTRRWQLAWFVTYFICLPLGFYLYVLLRVRPELFYQQAPAVFLFDAHFLAGFRDWPGGLVASASAFLSPLFTYGWLGALVVTVLTVLICLASWCFLAILTGTGGRFLFLIPAVLILATLVQYCHPVALCLGLCIALWATNGYARLPGNHWAIKLAVFLIISAVVYYLTAGLYVVFALLCGIFEWKRHRRRGLALVCVLAAALGPIAINAWQFHLSTIDAYGGLLLPSASHWLAEPSSPLLALTLRVGLLLFLPVVAICSAGRRVKAGRKSSVPQHENGSESPAEATCAPGPQHTASRLALPLAALLALVFATDWTFFDPAKQCVLQIADSADRQRWSEVLAHARRLPPAKANYLSMYRVNRALYFNGCLLEEMFAYFQVLNAPTLTLVRDNVTEMARTTPLECSEVLFELGRINESEHMAYEALERLGERPQILKRLVYINVLKGEPEAAKRFLAVLECSLLHRQWARHCRRQLDADPALSGVALIRSRRELMVVRDSIGPMGLETLLLQLLERNRHNRMAFEYLMAHYLLTGQLEKMAANLRRLDDFDMAQLPRHCEEALLILMEQTGRADLDLGGRQIGPQTRQRYTEFLKARDRFQNDPERTLNWLRQEFADTYFLCHAFGRNRLLIGP